MKRRLISFFCICMLLISLVPFSAHADDAIDKVLCTTSTIPVAQLSPNDIYANTSTYGGTHDSAYRKTNE